MKRIFDILIISVLSFTLAACGSNSGGGGSSGSSPTVGVTQTPKDLYSDWGTGAIPAPTLYLGFNTPQLDPQNIAVMYLNLENFHTSGGDSNNPGEVDIFIGPGIDALECIFQAWVIGDEHQGSIQSISFTTSGQNTGTADAILIQQNLHDYCNSLEGSYTYTINNNQLTLCPQGATGDACTRFQ
jgi:hypothetical protein